MYQLTSADEILARVENNFDVDFSDWVTRAPLWIADALDQMQMVNAYEDAYVDLPIVDHIVSLPEYIPTDIRRIQGVEYNGYLTRRLNVINPIRQPQVTSEYNTNETYSIKNGYIVTSFEEGTCRVYFQRPAVEYDVERQIYMPKVPLNSVAQGAIEWYIIYCILKRGHKHPTYSLESKNPITNPFTMWEREAKKAKNQVSAYDPADRAEMSRLIRTFLVDTDTPINVNFSNTQYTLLSDTITGQLGLT
jgi:hypothetical protein